MKMKHNAYKEMSFLFYWFVTNMLLLTQKQICCLNVLYWSWWVTWQDLHNDCAFFHIDTDPVVALATITLPICIWVTVRQARRASIIILKWNRVVIWHTYWTCYFLGIWFLMLSCKFHLSFLNSKPTTVFKGSHAFYICSSYLNQNVFKLNRDKNISLKIHVRDILNCQYVIWSKFSIQAISGLAMIKVE